jgi:hypothetical protein
MPRVRDFAAALLVTWLCLISSSAAQAAILVTINKAAQQMTVEVDGATRWTWPVSTGRRGYDTPAGSFHPFRMEEDHYSKEWDEAPMPYSIFFTAEGHAIHGSYETRSLGHAASHGCVRISPTNAAKLFALVKREGLGNARVVVINDPNMPLIAKRRAPARDAQTMQQARKPAPVQDSTAMPATSPTAEATTYAIAPDRAYGYARAPVERPAIDLPGTTAGPVQPRDWP